MTSEQARIANRAKFRRWYHRHTAGREKRATGPPPTQTVVLIGGQVVDGRTVRTDASGVVLLAHVYCGDVAFFVTLLQGYVNNSDGLPPFGGVS